MLLLLRNFIYWLHTPVFYTVALIVSKLLSGHLLEYGVWYGAVVDTQEPLGS